MMQMTKEELKKWFLNKFNSCYCVKYEAFSENVFMIYDKNFVRQQKLSRLIAHEIKAPTDGICLFILDYENERLWYDRNKIFGFFINNTDFTVHDVNLLIKCWLLEKSKIVHTHENSSSDYNLDISKLDILKPSPKILSYLIQTLIK